MERLIKKQKEQKKFVIKRSLKFNDYFECLKEKKIKIPTKI